jgi:hypothetical protein
MGLLGKQAGLVAPVPAERYRYSTEVQQHRRDPAASGLNAATTSVPNEPQRRNGQ